MGSRNKVPNCVFGMKKKAVILFVVFLVLAALHFSAFGSPSGSRESIADLYRVKKIFFRTGSERFFPTDSLRLRSTVRDELMQFGFVLVDNEDDADAVMEGGIITEEVTLDGPQPDAPEHGFQFSLASTKLNITWETKFNIRTGAKPPEVERKGIKKAAQNLFNAWKKSAQKAGIKTHDKVP